jgi:hypothetical protein
VVVEVEVEVDTEDGVDVDVVEGIVSIDRVLALIIDEDEPNTRIYR